MGRQVHTWSHSTCPCGRRERVSPECVVWSVWVGVNESGVWRGVEPRELGFVSTTIRAHTHLHTQAAASRACPHLCLPPPWTQIAQQPCRAHAHRSKHMLPPCASPCWPSAPLLPTPAPGQCAPWRGARASSTHQLSDTKRRATHLQRGCSFKDWGWPSSTPAGFQEAPAGATCWWPLPSVCTG